MIMGTEEERKGRTERAKDRSKRDEEDKTHDGAFYGTRKMRIWE